jgi:hypothetical protein
MFSLISSLLNTSLCMSELSLRLIHAILLDLTQTLSGLLYFEWISFLLTTNPIKREFWLDSIFLLQSHPVNTNRANQKLECSMFNKEELIGLVLIQPFQWMLRARLKKFLNSNPAYYRAKPVTYSTQYVFSIQAYLCYGGSAFDYTY